MDNNTVLVEINIKKEIEINLDDNVQDDVKNVDASVTETLQDKQVLKSEDQNLGISKCNDDESTNVPRNVAEQLHTVIDIKVETKSYSDCSDEDAAMGDINKHDLDEICNNPMILTKPTEQDQEGIKYQCKSCYRFFKNEQNILIHLERYRSPPGLPYKCKKIKKRKKNNTIYCCDVGKCTKKYSAKQHLKRHMRSHFTCKYCKSMLPTISDLEAHLEEHKSIECAYCELKFLKVFHLRNHIKSMHNEVKPFSCNVCHSQFSSHSSWMSHNNTVHKDIRPHVCVICNKRFGVRYKLKQHQSLHSDDRDFECEHCCLCFKNASQLKAHISYKHLSQKRIYECDICKKLFASKRYLTKHKKSHLDRQLRTPQYCCDICSKWFDHRQSMVNHFRVHSGEKPYECLDCGKCFALRTNMITHHRRIHMPKTGNGF